VIGDAGVEHVDGLFAERLFGHSTLSIIGAAFERPAQGMTA
jgi:hypothetical protein